MGKTVLYGGKSSLFSLLPPGLPSISSLDETSQIQTAFLGEGGAAGGQKKLDECIDKKIPFVIVGKGWSRGIPSPVRIFALKNGTKIVGPDSGGLITPRLSGEIKSVTAVIAEKREVFLETVMESKQRAIPLRYALSLGSGKDYSPVEGARNILEFDPSVRFFVFILERLRRGHELLQFAEIAAKQGKSVGLLEIDPQPGEDRVEASALAQFNIFTIPEPAKIIDGAAAFMAAEGRGEKGFFLEGNHGEIQRLIGHQVGGKKLPRLMADDGRSLLVKVLRGGEKSPWGSVMDKKIQSGRSVVLTSISSFPKVPEEAVDGAFPLIPGIGRCLEALNLVFSRRKGKGMEEGYHKASTSCPIHPRPTEHDAKILLKTFGIPVAREHLCHSFREADEAAESIGYPVALKVMSPNIIRKSEARVVALNLQDREELRNAYGRTLEKARVANKGAKIRGVLVQEMIRGGTEWRLEFRRDPRFGPVVEMSVSGVYTEIMADGVIRVAPFGEDEAMEMIRESRGYTLLLEGWQRKGLDVDAFASALSAFSRLAFCETEVDRLDVNPIFVNEKGVLVVDAFIEKKRRK